MVASLQNKKEALEAKLRDKTSELRKLCIEEAELTGALPAETPIDPGESPPQFRRRVGTAFTYPENLINKLRSKEDEALALELECKIQTGIAEAAKGLANDGSASKSVRRKHRLLYEDSQRRLSELEARLVAYRQAQPKQKKKPRPLTEFDETSNDADDVTDSGRYSMSQCTITLPERTPNLSVRHSHTYGGLSKQDFNIHNHHHRVIQSQMHLPGADYRYSVLDHHHYITRSNNPSPIDHNALWNKGRDVCNNHQPQLNQYGYSSGSLLLEAYHPELVSISNFSDRFGSLDRNSHYSEASDSENRTSATLPRNSTTPHSTVSVLLPNQTYPESSLMRTQSLGNMDNLKHNQERKKEKEWYETSLDSSPTVPKCESPYLKSVEGHASPSFSNPAENTLDNCVPRPNQASINNIQFDTVVPYESPKNHTVVQAGKWQPYREVTKPFEMSDFYKYSTKYRQQSKAQTSSLQLPHKFHENASTQQKGVYKAPVPLECQPLSASSENGNIIHQPNTHRQEELQNADAVAWYHNKNIAKHRSSTLV